MIWRSIRGDGSSIQGELGQVQWQDTSAGPQPGSCHHSYDRSGIIKLTSHGRCSGGTGRSCQETATNREVLYTVPRGYDTSEYKLLGVWKFSISLYTVQYCSLMSLRLWKKLRRRKLEPQDRLSRDCAFDQAVWVGLRGVDLSIRSLILGAVMPAQICGLGSVQGSINSLKRSPISK